MQKNLVIETNIWEKEQNFFVFLKLLLSNIEGN